MLIPQKLRYGLAYCPVVVVLLTGLSYAQSQPSVEIRTTPDGDPIPAEEGTTVSVTCSFDKAGNTDLSADVILRWPNNVFGPLYSCANINNEDGITCTSSDDRYRYLTIEASPENNGVEIECALRILGGDGNEVEKRVTLAVRERTTSVPPSSEFLPTGGPDSGKEQQDGHKNEGIIPGLVCGGIFLIFVIVIGVIFFCCCWKHHTRKSQSRDDNPTGDPGRSDGTGAHQDSVKLTQPGRGGGGDSDDTDSVKVKQAIESDGEECVQESGTASVASVEIKGSTEFVPVEKGGEGLKRRQLKRAK